MVGWVSWEFLCSIGEKPFSVGLVDQLFQLASNQVKRLKKLFALKSSVCSSRKDFSQELLHLN